MGRRGGAIACGHPATANAAAEILRDGGNAFDAIIAAHFAACVAEPVLASLGGGGFLMARPDRDKARLYDFFVQTPKQKKSADRIDFRPITANFGDDTQEFHVGAGAMATPGSVRGLFHAHRELGSLPMTRLVEPALELARRGVQMNDFQAYILDIVSPIYRDTERARQTFASPEMPERLIQAGERLTLSPLADLLEVLAREGERLFYEGEVAAMIAAQCEHGGHLTRNDLAQYRVITRQPLSVTFRDQQLLTNPPPSSGGLLIAFALKLLEAIANDRPEAGSYTHLKRLLDAMELTSKARVDAEALTDTPSAMLDTAFLQQYRDTILHRAHALRGTTHISITDTDGNLASLTVSNGEGCGIVLPDTGIMMNNMLGEEDLNPGGFHRWQPDQRMTSMMAPSLLLGPDGTHTVLGSGGSNRIRTALLQVLVNLVDLGMPLEQAIHQPRLHLERNRLSIEPGLDPAVLDALERPFPDQVRWQQPNLFFGGVHAVRHSGHQLEAVGDPRRGGASLTIQ